NPRFDSSLTLFPFSPPQHRQPLASESIHLCQSSHSSIVASVTPLFSRINTAVLSPSSSSHARSVSS
ncbi:unnamed protein product, partial [Brassica oleracea]